LTALSAQSEHGRAWKFIPSQVFHNRDMPVDGGDHSVTPLYLLAADTTCSNSFSQQYAKPFFQVFLARIEQAVSL
jgi:hypothetical protein